jgi:hypothetical protein
MDFCTVSGIDHFEPFSAMFADGRDPLEKNTRGIDALRGGGASPASMFDGSQNRVQCLEITVIPKVVIHRHI